MYFHLGENFIKNQHNGSRKIQSKYIWWRLKLFFACKLKLYWMFLINIAWKVSVFEIFLSVLSRISDWIRRDWMRAECGKTSTRKTPNTDTFHSGIFKIFRTVIGQVPSVKLHQNHVFFFQQSVFIKRMRPDYIINHMAFYFGSADAGNVWCLHH